MTNFESAGSEANFYPEASFDDIKAYGDAALPHSDETQTTGDLTGECVLYADEAVSDNTAGQYGAQDVAAEQPQDAAAAVAGEERPADWFRGGARSAGQEEPGPDGPATAQFYREGEGTGLIADFFETDMAAVREVLEDLGIDGEQACYSWSIAEGFNPSIGELITEAMDAKLAQRSEAKES